jgi:hypothetical protein
MKFAGTLWRIASRVTPWSVAVLCYFFVRPLVWAESASSLIALLSLVTAAILVRIMRAFPVTDPDGFAELDDIQTLEAALHHVMRSLSIAVGAALLAISLLVFRDALYQLITGVTFADIRRGSVFSAVVGWAIAYVIVRIVYVVRMDFSILGLQAKAARRIFERRRAKEISEARRRNEDNVYRFDDGAPYPGRERG